MKSLFRISFTAVIILGLLPACGKKEEPGMLDKMQQAAENMEKAAKGIEKTAKDMEKMENKEPVPPVHFTKLLEYLPKDAYGLNAEEPEGETGQMGEWKYSTVSARFSDGKGVKSAEVSIFDYAHIQMMYVPYMMLYNMGFAKESTKGYERSTKILDFPAFEKWEKSDKSEEVHAMVADRFIVMVKTRGFDAGQGKALLEKIDLKKLSTEKANEPAS